MRNNKDQSRTEGDRDIKNPSKNQQIQELFFLKDQQNRYTASQTNKKEKREESNRHIKK